MNRNKIKKTADLPPATLGYKSKPLGQWPDDEKHKATQTPQKEDEQSISGSMPDPEQVEDKDTLEAAKDAGLYSDYNEEEQGEVNIADEEKKDLDEEEHS